MEPIKNSGIIGWFASNNVAANLLLITTITVGVFSLGSIRKEAFPSLDPDRVTISVSYDSGSPLQAEEGIAIKIEEAIETISGIKRITSTSNGSGANVMIEKTTDYDLDTLFDDIKNEVDAINNFPSDADNPVVNKATRQDHAIWLQLYGDTDRATLQQLAEQLKVDLLAKSAISDLSIEGKADPMISVEVNEAKLQAYGLTLSDVAAAINAESTTTLTTSLRSPSKILSLRASDQAYRKQDFTQIPVVISSNGATVTLGEVATITDGFADDSYVFSRYNGKPTVGIKVVMGDHDDVTAIVEQSKEVIEKWHERGLLPTNVDLTSWYDSSVMIKERLDLLIKNAVSGIVMVFIILAIFLNLRVAFWVAAGLPFIFFGTLIFMTERFTGLTINAMTTFGFIMALGIVVDDAVVIGESIYDTRRKDGDTLANTVRGTLKVAVPTIFGVLTTVAAFMALTQVAGRMGQIYAQFATVVTIALLLSLIESKLILPSHLAHLNTHRHIKPGLAGLWSRVQHGADAGLQWFNDKLYHPVIRWALEFRYAVVLGFIALLVLVVGMPMTGAVKISFFPSIPGDTVTATMTMQDDASFGQTHSNLLRIEKMAHQADDKLRGENPTGISSLQILADDDLEGTVTVELAKDVSYGSQAFTQLWSRLSGSPEGVKTLSLSSSRQMVDNFKVELMSSSNDTVTAAGKAFEAYLHDTGGVSGIDSNLNPGQPLLHFELTPQGRALGMETADLSEQVLQLFGGEVVQRFQRDSDEFKVRVRYPQADRQTLADVQQAHVRTPDGTVVPLVNVASITAKYQQDEITRIDGQRAVYLSATVDKDVIAPNELVAQMNQDLVPKLTRQYSDLSIHFAGEAEHQAESSSSMKQMFILALFAIYILLAIPLRSYSQPLVIMTAIPFGIVGAIIGHWWSDLTISILSLNGILALSGVVVNDSLLLVSRFNELRAEGLSLSAAIEQSCQGRLRAVLLTSATTFAGLMPLLSETSLQAQFLIPAAASLGYGILFATAITLVLIPSLLMIGQDIRQLANWFTNFVRGWFSKNPETHPSW
jgi:multidrug efflux pump subunit AcrB